MTYDEILALDERGLDAAVADRMGDVLDGEGWWVSKDGTKFCHEDGGPREYTKRDAPAVIEHFKLSLTPKRDATRRSRWLADLELRGEGCLWLGWGPTIGVAACRAALMRYRTDDPSPSHVVSTPARPPG